MTDYAAAHSMDTIWFAVDRDGHVGRFDTGENGPVPAAAPAGYSEAVASAVAAGLANRPAAEPIHDSTLLRLGNWLRHVHEISWDRDPVVVHLNLVEPAPPDGTDRSPRLGGAADPATFGPAGMDPMLPLAQASAWLGRLPCASEAARRAAAALAEALRDGTAVPVPASAGAAVLLAGGSAALLRRLHEADLCLCCEDRWPDDYPGSGNALAAKGLFVYRNEDCYDDCAGPYLRERMPAAPARIDEWPEAREKSSRQCGWPTCRSHSPRLSSRWPRTFAGPGCSFPPTAAPTAMRSRCRRTVRRAAPDPLRFAAAVPQAGGQPARSHRCRPRVSGEPAPPAHDDAGQPLSGDGHVVAAMDFRVDGRGGRRFGIR